MRRVLVKQFGGPEQLIVDSAAIDPTPAAGQVLVDVEAAGINYLDVYQRNGSYPIRLPVALGLEGVGRIRALGEGAAHISPALAQGARVAWINVPGSYADKVALPAAEAILIPNSFQTEQGLLFQALTAQYLAHEYRQVSAGCRVLVHSAAGGVGQLLVQWLKHLGAWVVGTTSSDAKAAIVTAAGADAVINYGDDYRFLEELKSLTEGDGVDLAFDGVGAKTLERSLDALSPGGTVVSYGHASGPAPAIDPSRLVGRCTRLAGGSVFTYTADPVQLQKRAAQVIEGIRAGWLRLNTATGYHLTRVSDAHRDIQSRATYGKLYLSPGA